MKNLLLLATLFTLVFIGCKKKDKIDPADPDPIVAKWNFQKVETVTLKNGDEDDSESEIYAPGSYVEFKSDRTFTLHAKEISEDEFEEYSSTYVLTGDKLTLVDPDEETSDIFQIKTLDKNNLIFERNKEYEADGDTYKITSTFHLSK